MGDIKKWCQMCGAAPGEPCTVISGYPDEPDQQRGDVRKDVHWARSADHRPAVLIPDEPPYER